MEEFKNAGQSRDPVIAAGAQLSLLLDELSRRQGVVFTDHPSRRPRRFDDLRTGRLLFEIKVWCVVLRDKVDRATPGAFCHPWPYAPRRGNPLLTKALNFAQQADLLADAAIRDLRSGRLK